MPHPDRQQNRQDGSGSRTGIAARRCPAPLRPRGQGNGTAVGKTACETVDASALDDGRTIVSNSRHYEALHHARTALDAALGGLETLPSDLLGEEIRQAIFHLGTITGEITTDEVLGQIFSKFCIGK